jgi:nickel/cobalt transporter (NiCoT) family protein
MCLLDTTDGALMMALYTSKAFARDTIAILYYSAVLTGITVVVSAFIGVIQVLSLVQNVADPQGSFWDGVSAIGDNFEIIGGSICGLFLVVGLGSVLVYKPWRRRMERRRSQGVVVVASGSTDGVDDRRSTERPQPEAPELIPIDPRNSAGHPISPTSKSPLVDVQTTAGPS